MSIVACISCNADFLFVMRGSGRPRRKCFDCSPQRIRSTPKKYTPVPLSKLACDYCGGKFEGRKDRLYCSERCSDLFRGVDCSACGKRVVRSSTSADVQVCLDCRRTGKAIKHGTVHAYVSRRCRCVSCRAAKASEWKAYADRRRAAGNPLPSGGRWITEDDRQKVYERDNRVCQLCFEPVDFSVSYRDLKAPTLDHVVPRSRGGSDDLDNLRLACRQCNCSRGDRMDWEVPGVAG